MAITTTISTTTTTTLAVGGRVDKYIELHGRSAFSFLRGASSPRALAEAAAGVELPGMALCDRNGVYGAPAFHVAARAAGVRAYIGAELEMEDGTVLPVLAASREGYRNLCGLLTEAHLRSEKGGAQVRWGELEGRVRGLVALTGDEEGPLHRAWRDGDRGAVQAVLDALLRAFGREGVYVEVQRHLVRGEQLWIRFVRDVAEQSGLPLLATNGVCYALPEQRKVQDVFTCLRAHTRLDEAGRRLSRNAERAVKGPGQMAALFRDLPGAVAETVRLAERLEFSLEDLGYEFPRYPVPAGESMDSFLRKIVWFGAEQRYGSLGPEVRAQLRRELDLIARFGFSGYFLIVWDIVNYAREEGILVQGRGSAANSAVCYALGITPVDPVGGRLLFERFLNEGRRSWPDIDLDLPSGERRERVIQEVYRRYGKHGAAMTANVITYQGRSTARELGKVLGFGEETLDRLSAVISSGRFSKTADVARRLGEAGLQAGHPRVRTLVELYGMVRGLPRHLGQHSGGMIICQHDLSRVVPLENARMPGRVVAQWDKEACEDMGIIKVDLLGLGMMAAMQDMFGMLRARGVSIDLARIPRDDPATFELLQKADTVGTFQVESRAQMATLPRMKPRCFYDVVIEVAIIRPGPIQGKMVNPYLERRAGRQAVHYIDERLKPDLERTLGVPLFQEQILRMAMVLGGFSGAQAERMRRAVTFYRNDERMDEVTGDLVAAMRERGEPESKVEQVVEAIRSFSHYGFPESHAISFGILAYASCYLKVHFPAEFYAALLNNQPMGFYAPSTLVQDARRRGVRMLPVCIAASDWDCTVADSRTVRLGLRLVGGVGAPAAGRMLAERARRPFGGMRDFLRRAGFNREERRALAGAGALNALAGHRRQALWDVEAPVDPQDLFAAAEEKEGRPGPLAPMTRRERVEADFDRLGLSVGKHPMAMARAELPGVLTAGELAGREDGVEVTVAGQAICRQRPGSARGMVFISLEDETGVCNCIVAPRLFEEKRLLINQEPYLKISGTLQNREGVIHVRARRIFPLEVEGLPFSASHDYY